MTAGETVQWAAVASAGLFVWYCPIFKPYFGFRRPNASR